MRHRLVAVVSSRNETVLHGRIVAHDTTVQDCRSSGRRQLCTLSSAQSLVVKLCCAALMQTWWYLVQISFTFLLFFYPFSYRERIKLKLKKAKAQVLGIAPLNMQSTCQQRFTIVEVVTV